MTQQVGKGVKAMKVFDINKLTSHPYEERDKNVFYQAQEFKTRIIELPPGGQMPVCEMVQTAKKPWPLNRWQGEIEGASFSYLALHPHFPTMRFHKLFNYGQTNPWTAIAPMAWLISFIKMIEDIG